MARDKIPAKESLIVLQVRMVRYPTVGSGSLKFSPYPMSFSGFIPCGTVLCILNILVLLGFLDTRYSCVVG
jgi:hypothetical protein